MDITTDRRNLKKGSGHVSATPLKDKHIENIKKVNPVIIPGTSILLPPFDYDDPNMRSWLNNRISKLKMKDPKFTYEEFLKKLATRIFFIDDNNFNIDIADLIVEDGKICALPPNWRYLHRKKEKELRKKWIEKSGFTEEEYEARLKIARENLKKDQIHK